MSDLDLSIFGKRVKDVRDDILNMTQQAFADEVNTNQVLLSRLENGQGGNINLIFDIINFIYQKGFNGSMLFDQNFDIKTFKKKEPNNRQNIREEIDQIKALTQNFYEQILKVTNS